MERKHWQKVLNVVLLVVMVLVCIALTIGILWALAQGLDWLVTRLGQGITLYERDVLDSWYFHVATAILAVFATLLVRWIGTKLKRK